MRGSGVVLGQELRDLWLGGRALALTIGFSLLLSVIAYLAASNQVLNFLEQRETVNLTLQVAVAVGALLALLAAADAVSGERGRRRSRSRPRTSGSSAAALASPEMRSHPESSSARCSPSSSPRSGS
jgi:hypothetical protein